MNIGSVISSFLIIAFGLCAQSCSSLPKELDITALASPGEVLVNIPKNQNHNGNPDMICTYLSYSVDPIKTLKSPSGYGLDALTQIAASAMINMGTSCYSGSIKDCLSAVDMMESWAKANAVQVNSFGNSNILYWNDTLAVNLRIVRPFIGTYSIAKSKINPSSELDEKIRDWMYRTIKRASHLMRTNGTYTSGGASGTRKAAHNHAVASSAAWMAYGAMWNDPSAFKRGLEQWFITLNSMRKDGSFPIETRRGSRALFYTGKTLCGLMSIAEMAKVQGIDLFSYSPSENKNIHIAVRFMLDALEDNRLVLKYASENFMPGPDKNYRNQFLGGGDTFGWIYPYALRFPDHPNSSRIRKLPYWGRPLCGDWIGTCPGCLYHHSY